jgi:hypothetical protein
MTTTRDDRHRRAAKRLRRVTVALAAEVRARGGSLDWHPDLTDEERAEAEQEARNFWRGRLVAVRDRGQNRAETCRMDRLASTD